MPTIKLSDTEVLQVIHHINNLDMAKHLAQKLQQAINGSVTEEPKRNGYVDIADALGMPYSKRPDIYSILDFIKENCTKDMRLQRATLTKDNAKAAELLKVMAELLELPENKQYDNMPEMLTLALAESGRRSNVIRDQALQIEQDARDNEYLRASLKQIEEALVLPPGYTAAYLVEQVGIRAKSHDVLRQFMQASGFTDNDGVPTMLSVLEYRKSVTAAADAAAEESPLDSAQYVVVMNDHLKRLHRKLSAITDIFNERPRSGNDSDWARIAEILG